MARAFVALCSLFLLSAPAHAEDKTYEGDLFSFTYPADTWRIDQEENSGSEQHLTLVPKEATGVMIQVFGLTTKAEDDGSELKGKPGFLAYAFLKPFLQRATGSKDASRIATSFGRMKMADGEQPSCIMMIPSPKKEKSFFLAETFLTMTTKKTAIGAVVLSVGYEGEIDSRPLRMGQYQQAYDIVATMKAKKAPAAKKAGK